MKSPADSRAQRRWNLQVARWLGAVAAGLLLLWMAVAVVRAVIG